MGRKYSTGFGSGSYLSADDAVFEIENVLSVPIKILSWQLESTEERIHESQSFATYFRSTANTSTDGTTASNSPLNEDDPASTCVVIYGMRDGVGGTLVNKIQQYDWGKEHILGHVYTPEMVVWVPAGEFFSLEVLTTIPGGGYTVQGSLTWEEF